MTPGEYIRDYTRNVKMRSNKKRLTICQSFLFICHENLFIHEPFDTHLRSFLERLGNSFCLCKLAV